LFGTTWITSAVVIIGVLMMILSANILVILFRGLLSGLLTPLYAVLAAALIGSYMLQVDDVLAWNSSALGKSLITAVTLVPMFIAGLIFPISFARHRDSATAFAFNLCGATIGALLEYQSNFTGINSLVLVSSVLYLLSYLSLQMKGKPEDEEADEAKPRESNGAEANAKATEPEMKSSDPVETKNTDPASE
jgi:hypothetical protein